MVTACIIIIMIIYNTLHANEMFIIILGILLCACDYMKDKHSFGCSVYNNIIIIIVLYIIIIL